MAHDSFLYMVIANNSTRHGKCVVYNVLYMCTVNNSNNTKYALICVVYSYFFLREDYTI